MRSHLYNYRLRYARIANSITVANFDIYRENNRYYLQHLYRNPCHLCLWSSVMRLNFERWLLSEQYGMRYIYLSCPILNNKPWAGLPPDVCGNNYNFDHAFFYTRRWLSYRVLRLQRILPRSMLSNRTRLFFNLVPNNCEYNFDQQ